MNDCVPPAGVRIGRRAFTAAMLVAAGAGSTGAVAAGDGLTLIEGGTVIDGTGRAGIDAVVAMREARIVHVGDRRDVPGRPDRVIDARGMIVAPGFIDLHAHGDPLDGPQLASLHQGVTTIVVGQDGRTPGPSYVEGVTLAQWMQRVAAKRSHVHVATLSGHGTNRMKSGAKFVPQPSPAQRSATAALLRADLAAGAFGMSTALEYEPGRFTARDELIELADIIAAADGVVMSHVRSEDGDRIDASIDELIDQGARARVHAAHLKIVYERDPAHADRLLQKMRDARARGVRISADAYPYTAAFGNLGLLYPDWISDAASWDAAMASRRAETLAYLAARIDRRGGAEAILIGTGPDAGRTLAEVAGDRGVSPAQAVIDYGYGGPGAAHFIIDAAVQDRFVTAPDIAVGSDGSPGMRHPRAFGSFPRVLQTYRERGLPVEQAVHKMTGMAAAILGLSDRGTIRVGSTADLVIFDPAAVRDNATWTKPDTPPSGIELVMLDGQVAFERGRIGTPAGRVLRKGMPCL